MKSQPALSRREFLRTTGISGLGLAAAGWAMPARAVSPADRVLVFIQLSGGNDGLNTLVPFADPAYYSARPVIAIQPRHVLSPGTGRQEGLGFHPAMRPLMGLWESGRMAVIHGVGYPNPNRSHFRSLEVWHSATENHGMDEGGWVGRCFDRHRPSLAVSVGWEAPASLKGPGLAGVHLHEPASVFHAEEGADEVAQAALEKTRDLLRNPGRAGAVYPDTRFASGLKQIAALVDGGLGARVYHHDITGFDTHSSQPVAHARLWSEVSQGLRAFFTDLEARGLADRVVAVGYSEFGRRVAENGLCGTDHGAAGPMFVWGKPVRGGMYGELPSLTNLDDGDLKCTTDFRSVYATLLDRWLDADHAAVLGREYSRLPFLAA